MAAGILAMCTALLLVRSSALQKQYHRLQVRVAAQALAADLRCLQQEALFQAADAQTFLTVGSDKTKYSFKKGMNIIRTVRFTSLNCEGVYFSSGIDRLAFSKAGNPTASGSYILKHNDLPNYRCQLSLQPVTGRVSVYEKE